jgi:hypothetical protein
LTPPEIVAAVGPFDLDPCAAVDQPWATARYQYTVLDDGLRKPWFGFVWCNPPFGRVITQWLSRLADHDHGIGLVPARTETRWFIEQVWRRAMGVLFLHGRLRFHHRNGQPATSSIGTPIGLVAYGQEALQRLRSSSLAGTLARWGPP